MLLVIGNNMLKCRYKYHCFYSAQGLKPGLHFLVTFCMACLKNEFVIKRMNIVILNSWDGKQGSLWCLIIPPRKVILNKMGGFFVDADKHKFEEQVKFFKQFKEMLKSGTYSDIMSHDQYY